MSGNYISWGGVLLIFLSVLGGVESFSLFSILGVPSVKFDSVCSFWVFTKFASVSGGLMEYFLVQGFYSCLVILLYLHYPLMFSFSSFLVVSVLMLKLGVAPFHSWLINLFGVLDWETLWLMSVVQKILPVFGVAVFWGSLSVFGSGFVVMVITLSVLASVSLSLVELGIGKLLGLSSLFNQAWLLSAAQDIHLLMSYLVLYGISMSVFVLWLSAGGYVVTSSLSEAENLMAAGVGFLGLASLAGLPPFGFFFAKVQVVRFLSGYAPGLSLFLLLSSVFMLLIYGRLFMPLILSLNKLSGRSGNWLSGWMVGGLALSSFIYF
uniref:NADH-ubiquinone oxidoreductase chain 2 n=1 Tax=Tigriopus japonicus TaxID=158387 RepID=Q1EDK4_TIGJA|nr:NADH dehydrogenase subunit 2 [Tigriopus japonicus]